MTYELIELAKRLVDWEEWEWRRGMTWLTHDGDEDWYTAGIIDPGAGAYPSPNGPALPALDDDATGGVLLGMVFERARLTDGLVECSATLDAEERPVDVEVYLYPNERRYHAPDIGAAAAKALLGEEEEE